MTQNITVHETEDHSIFQMLDDNRQLDVKHVKYLARVLQKENITKRAPIIVNDYVEVIDGQHRVAAYRKLAEEGSILPITYIKIKGLRSDDARRINAGHKKWQPIDYARSYAKKGNLSYAVFVEYHEEMRRRGLKLNAEILQRYLSRDGKYSTEEFNLEQFEVNERKFIRRYIDQLISLQSYYREWQNRAFALAALHVFKMEGYDHKRFVTNLDKHKKRLESVPLKTSDLKHALLAIYHD